MTFWYTLRDVYHMFLSSLLAVAEKKKTLTYLSKVKWVNRLWQFYNGILHNSEKILTNFIQCHGWILGTMWSKKRKEHIKFDSIGLTFKSVHI